MSKELNVSESGSMSSKNPKKTTPSSQLSSQVKNSQA